MKNKTSKLILLFTILGIFFIAAIAIIINPGNIIPIIEKNVSINLEPNKIDVSELYIYGNHLNIIGSFIDEKEIEKIELVLFDKKEQNYEFTFTQNNNNDNKVDFYISSKKNDGLLLDQLEIGDYQIYIKVDYVKGKTKYYNINNISDYSETEYYTIHKNNKCNHILINEKVNTLQISVKESQEDEIYDIIIDPGHAGIDTGACSGGICETDITLSFSQKLKIKLEENNLKVKLTHEIKDKSTKFETYGENGRIATAMKSKSKYLFSIHLNSGLKTMNGFEIYTANNINYSLASSIANSIVNSVQIAYSNNTTFRVDKGVYTRTFRNHELQDVINDATRKGYETYNVTNNTVYYYIIRETGGILNGAYVDGRDKETNPYYNTNVGIESYILELGYITNTNDIENIKNNIDKYVEAIAQAIIKNI